ncbi:MAG: hypothetical protein R2865_10095 [Deinococcales bacterium]
MTMVQGFSPDDIDRDELKPNVAYVPSLSNGEEIHLDLSAPKMQEMYDLGELLWFYRASTGFFL